MNPRDLRLQYLSRMIMKPSFDGTLIKQAYVIEYYVLFVTKTFGSANGVEEQIRILGDANDWTGDPRNWIVSRIHDSSPSIGSIN